MSQPKEREKNGGDTLGNVVFKIIIYGESASDGTLFAAAALTEQYFLVGGWLLVYFVDSICSICSAEPEVNFRWNNAI